VTANDRPRTVADGGLSARGDLLKELGVYRPTALKAASRHCPRVLDHLAAGDPYERTGFEAGIAAHSVLQAVGEATERAGCELGAVEVDRVAGDVCRALIETGRTFDGNPEPPLAADNVWAGRDIALRWLSSHPISPGGRYEVGLAVDAQWRPVPYDSPLARLRAILDVIRTEDAEDEESAWRVVVLRDYKSAWSTDAGELDTLQLRSHAVLAEIHFGADADVIRREVVNLRTMKTYGGGFEHELQMADEGSVATLRRWRDDLQSTMESYDAMVDAGTGLRPANPGAGCDGCPFLPLCVEAHQYVDRAEALAKYGTPEDRARSFAVAYAVAAGLRERLKRETDGGDVIDLGDAVVGFVGKPSREASALAYETLYEHWMANGGSLSEGAVRGLLRSMRLGLGTIENVARALFPGRNKVMKASREDLVDLCSVDVVRSDFGVHPKSKAAEEAA
jgi:hypothetical protein